MPLTNADLTYYDSNVLRLTAEKRKEYHGQVDNLIAELRNHVTEKSDLKITRVVKAGSFAKYTILRKTNEDDVDVDVVFYISGQDIKTSTRDSLNDLIHSLLMKIYPNKSVDDFEIQKRAATVTFVKSGLAVDIVPVIQDASSPDHGYQFDRDTGARNRTCAPCHIKFVQDRKNKDKYFRTLVRMAKRWRNFEDIKGLKSFHIELIMAFLLDRDGSSESIEKRFREFLLYIAQSGLNERIDFVENRQRPKSVFNEPVVIVDPANSENNVASRISVEEKQTIVGKAYNSWEIANEASSQEDEGMWKEVFGLRFKIKD